jgi:hypothetical protein
VIVAIAIATLAILAVAFWVSGVMRVSAGVLTTTQNAAAIMRDPALDDLQREKAIQRASLRLLGDFGSILVRGVLSLAISFAPIWLADVTGLASSRAVIDFLSRTDVIVVASVVMVVGYVIRVRMWPSN